MSRPLTIALTAAALPLGQAFAQDATALPLGQAFAQDATAPAANPPAAARATTAVATPPYAYAHASAGVPGLPLPTLHEAQAQVLLSL